MAVPPGRAVVVVEHWSNLVNMSKLSIIIPTLNEADIVAGALTRLQSLRSDNIELIIADGGSTDNTVALAEPLVDQVWFSDPGRARQMNSGAMIASGDYLLFLHIDTQLPEDFADVWQRIQQYQPLWGFFKVKLSGSPSLLRMVEAFMNLRSRITSIATGDQCIYVRCELFERLEGFADIPLMEDVELSARLRRHKRARWIEQSVITSSRRWEKQGVWKTVWLMWRLRLSYFFGADPKQLAHRYYPSAAPFKDNL